MTPKRWRVAQKGYFILDIMLIALADILGLAVRFELSVPADQIRACLMSMPITLPLRMLIMIPFGMYTRLWRYASVRDLAALSVAVTAGADILLLVGIVLPGMRYSRGAMLVSYLLTLAFIGLSRFWPRIKSEPIRNGAKGNGHADGAMPARPITHALIVGAGSAGVMVAKELFAHGETGRIAVGFVDDDPAKIGGTLQGLPVLGTREDIRYIVQRFHVEEIIVAMPSVPGTVIREVLASCKDLKVRILTLPGMYELVDGKVSVKQLRDIQIEDLLGREPVVLDLEEVGAYLTGQTVMVTGAGGSIGSEICRQITRFKPENIILLGHGENSIFEIEQELKRRHPEQRTVAVIADIRDAERIDKVFEQHKPDVVFHAAAHKHVPLMEANPQEALSNNVVGTRNVARAADKHGAKRFVMISTDKAVNPVSVMGMSKRVAEMVVQSVGANSKTKFMAVRFGNVLGSRGSVVPTFRRQIAEGGPITVTHPDMTRYFMTIPEAVQLVIQAGAMGKGGEVFILDMGEPVKIVHLAEEIIRLSGMEPGKDIEIVYTGVRPGEKMFEEILTSEEKAVATRHSKIFVSKDSEPHAEALKAMLDEVAVTLEDAGLEQGRAMLAALLGLF